MKDIKSYIKTISEIYMRIYLDGPRSCILTVDTLNDYPAAVTEYSGMINISHHVGMKSYDLQLIRLHGNRIRFNFYCDVDSYPNVVIMYRI